MAGGSVAFRVRRFLRKQESSRNFHAAHDFLFFRFFFTPRDFLSLLRWKKMDVRTFSNSFHRIGFVEPNFLIPFLVVIVEQLNASAKELPPAHSAGSFFPPPKNSALRGKFSRIDFPLF